jgi:hypothetical protein
MRLPRTTLLLLGYAVTASAQARPRPAIADSSAARIMALVAAHPGVSWLQDILRTADAMYPQAKLDEIADSLVARAIDPAGVDDRRSEAYGRDVDAVNALGRAGRRWSSPDRPYAGMLDRLIAVHLRASSRRIRHRALIYMLSAPEHERAVAYVRQVAESSDSTAYDAVRALIDDTNGGHGWGLPPTAAERQQSVAALKALAARGRVTNTVAKIHLENFVGRFLATPPPADDQ